MEYIGKLMFALCVIVMLLQTSYAANALINSEDIIEQLDVDAYELLAKQLLAKQGAAGEPLLTECFYSSRKVNFLLFNKTNEKPIAVSGDEVPNPDKWNSFDPSRETKFIIHGWLQNGYTFAEEMRSDYLALGNLNVITVDWGDLSRCTYLVTKNRIIPRVGQTTAVLIENLMKEFKADPKKMHVIGHSFGAHVAGFAGKNLKPVMIDRITGLDPAGPVYQTDPPSKRLNSSDADFVDIIHTNGGVAGIAKSIGDADFRPNGGVYQPGCGAINLPCSHERSVLYFLESIRNLNHFCSNSVNSYVQYVACYKLLSGDSKAYMGEHVSRSAKGDYYLITRSKEPFGLDCNTTAIACNVIH